MSKLQLKTQSVTNYYNYSNYHFRFQKVYIKLFCLYFIESLNIVSVPNVRWFATPSTGVIVTSRDKIIPSYHLETDHSTIMSILTHPH